MKLLCNLKFGLNFLPRNLEVLLEIRDDVEGEAPCSDYAESTRALIRHAHVFVKFDRGVESSQVSILGTPTLAFADVLERTKGRCISYSAAMIS